MEEIARWAAPAFTTIAALMTASNLGSRVTGWGFAVFLGGSILWTALGVLTGQPNLVWQNIVLSLLNVFGIWRWLGRQRDIEEGGQKAQAKSRAGTNETLFPVSLLSSGTIVGRDGTKLGTAIEAMVGCRTGRIVYLVAGEGGVAGVGEHLHRLDWDEVRVGQDKLMTDRSSLEGLTTVERDNWPGR
jgi:hypothetical protein